MLFIRNYAPTLKDETITMHTTMSDDNLLLLMDFENIDKSYAILNIDMGDGDITDKMEDAMLNSINLLETSTMHSKFLSINTHVAGVKTVFRLDNKDMVLCNNLDYVKQGLDKNGNVIKYPKDMIIIFAPAGSEYNCYFDTRNLSAPVKSFNNDDFTLFLLFPKYPVWSKLKYPAYGYISKGRVPGVEAVGECVIGAFQLSHTGEGKHIKNSIDDVDSKIAFEYLIESFRLRREKNEAQKQKRSTEQRGDNNFTAKKYSHPYNGEKPSYKNKRKPSTTNSTNPVDSRTSYDKPKAAASSRRPRYKKNVH